ncbi:MAG: dienelactone hydrolase family protein [Myxococcota bacterium]
MKAPVEIVPATHPRGGVVLVSEVWGVNDDLRAWAGRLADAGFDVAMPDLWWRTGRPPLGSPEQIREAVAGLADYPALADVATARDRLDATRPRFVMGFCMGGLYARMAACALPGLAGAVEFYGRIVYPTITPQKPAQPLDLLPGLSCPLQCHFGDADPVAPPEHVDQLEQRLAVAPRAAQVLRYPGCGHAFMNRGGPHWSPDAAELAFARACHFLGHLAAAAG